MKEQIEELKRYAVRLKSGNNNLGSGVLWKPIAILLISANSRCVEPPFAIVRTYCF